MHTPCARRQIEELKREMDEATGIAELVRRDLAALAARTASVSLGERCARCGRALADAPPPIKGVAQGVLML
jgi:hypothetical protein